MNDPLGKTFLPRLKNSLKKLVGFKTFIEMLSVKIV